MAVRSIPDSLGTGAEILGSYALKATVTTGEFTSVHIAQATRPEEPGHGILIKRVQPKYAADPGVRDVFLASARYAMFLSSGSSFARVLEVHEDPQPFLVMEQLSGITLERALALVSPRDAARYFISAMVSALMGLQELHQAGRATGANNVSVHSSPVARHIQVGVDGRVRLLDFGHVVGPSIPWTPRRDEQLEPAEMAPEQALAPARVDPRCDIFIAGATLWQLLTGTPLFGGDTREQRLECMLRTSVVPPSELGAPVDRNIDQVLLRALQRNRADRFASAQEMAQALGTAASAAGLYVGPDELGAWVEATAQQHAAGARRQQLRSTLIGVGLNGSSENRYQPPDLPTSSECPSEPSYVEDRELTYSSIPPPAPRRFFNRKVSIANRKVSIALSVVVAAGLSVVWAGSREQKPELTTPRTVPSLKPSTVPEPRSNDLPVAPRSILESIPTAPSDPRPVSPPVESPLDLSHSATSKSTPLPPAPRITPPPPAASKSVSLPAPKAAASSDASTPEQSTPSDRFLPASTLPQHSDEKVSPEAPAEAQAAPAEAQAAPAEVPSASQSPQPGMTLPDNPY